MLPQTGAVVWAAEVRCLAVLIALDTIATLRQRRVASNLALAAL